MCAQPFVPRPLPFPPQQGCEPPLPFSCVAYSAKRGTATLVLNALPEDSPRLSLMLSFCGSAPNYPVLWRTWRRVTARSRQAWLVTLALVCQPSSCSCEPVSRHRRRSSATERPHSIPLFRAHSQQSDSTAEQATSLPMVCEKPTGIEKSTRSSTRGGVNAWNRSGGRCAVAPRTGPRRA